MTQEQPTIDPTAFTDQEKALIKAAQLERALGGSDPMLIHLGKTVLGQKETVKHEVTPVPLSEFTYEQLLEKLAHRQEAILEEQEAAKDAALVTGLNQAILALPSAQRKTKK